MEELYLKKFRQEFGSRKKCYELLLKIRMQGQKKCLTEWCPGTVEKDYVLLQSRPTFFCKKCFHQFSPQVDSIFDHGKKDIVDIFEIIYRFLSTANGISALQIRKDYNFSERAAFYIMHDIREQMGKCLDFYFENTIVELDESYFPTGNKGMDRHFPWKKGRGSDRCDSAFAIQERNGKVRIFQVDDCSRDTLEPLISKYIDKSCIVCTDKWEGYNRLSTLGYDHKKVEHEKYGPGKYVNGVASTNTNEGTWSFLKKTIYGVYGSTSPQHLQKYLDEKCFRASYKNLDDSGFTVFLNSFNPL